jgi:hypothetical protein
MDESEAVLARLERIEALDRAGAEPGEIVAELRVLVEEAVAWSRVEGGGAGEEAVDELRKAVETAKDRILCTEGSVVGTHG